MSKKQKKGKLSEKQNVKFYYKTIEEIIDIDKKYENEEGCPLPFHEDKCPLPIGVIPNYMGINLCSVDGIGWQMQSDTQLVSLTIYFIPAKDGDND